MVLFSKRKRCRDRERQKYCNPFITRVHVYHECIFKKTLSHTPTYLFYSLYHTQIFALSIVVLHGTLLNSVKNFPSWYKPSRRFDKYRHRIGRKVTTWELQREHISNSESPNTALQQIDKRSVYVLRFRCPNQFSRHKSAFQHKRQTHTIVGRLPQRHFW